MSIENLDGVSRRKQYDAEVKKGQGSRTDEEVAGLTPNQIMQGEKFQSARKGEKERERLSKLSPEERQRESDKKYARNRLFNAFLAEKKEERKSRKSTMSNAEAEKELLREREENRAFLDSLEAGDIQSEIERGGRTRASAREKDTTREEKTTDLMDEHRRMDAVRNSLLTSTPASIRDTHWQHSEVARSLKQNLAGNAEKDKGEMADVATSLKKQQGGGGFFGWLKNLFGGGK